MFEIGDRVVVRGRGLGTVSAIRDGTIVVTEANLSPGEESQFEVPVGSEAIRPIVTREEAERVLGVLRTKIDRPADRAMAYRRAHKRGDLEEQARMLAAMENGKAEAPETQYQERIEAAVFGELGMVLGISRRAMRARIKKLPPPLPDRTAELAAIEVPARAGYETIGAFYIDTHIAAGECSPSVQITDCERGVWFAYARRAGDDFDELIAVHRDAKPGPAPRLGEFGIEAAHVTIMDAGAVDREMTDEIQNATFDIVEGRCAVVALGGDGVGTVFGNRNFIRVVL